MFHKLVYDFDISKHRYLRHFEVPQFADYEPLRRILATRSKTRCRKSAPICILLGANTKFSAAQKAHIFYAFPRHPRQKRPWSCHYAFCGGVLSPPVFLRCFRGTRARSGPGATILHSVWGPSAHLDSGIKLRTANLMGPCGGPPRCRAPSVLGPGAFFAVISSRFPTRHILRDKLTR